ncbi:Chemotaxis response - phosphatase CheZ [Methylophaga thiooxydans]|uniref:Protein phosphatase CheZ n=1 Tax=Methylophaga thiooxydans TaxID=392484 RepID=A0A0A0BHJ3_9GAMM|nr:protein phosphatase CheZ [Methylophaga thiooxydans]KGM07335.1 Chemotaxis response - phosphatase CheZ [Methylophaga thiooxydans]
MASHNKQLQLDAAHALIDALEANNETVVHQQLTILTQSHENELFQEVGKLTRELHEALNNFNIDSRLVDMAQNDMPDTRERLNYVITTTEEAAHKTLGYIDNTLPLAQELRETAEKIDESWQRFRNKEMSADEFRVLVKEIEAYLPTVKQHADQVHANLSEMTLAQGFQDLTGQVIRQVIALVEEVERNLVQLVKVAGKQQTTEAKKEKVDPIKAEGPQINSQDKHNVVNNQDDVDDLLSSLGF